ncbi:hypothetical protein LXL04_011633 [Taraxacum kok-saghyz]
MAQNSDPSKPSKPGTWPPGQDSNDAPAMPPSSWAKRTGFRPRFSGETNASDSGQITRPPVDLEAGRVPPAPAMNGTAPPPSANAQVQAQSDKDQSVKKGREPEGGPARLPTKPGPNRPPSNNAAARKNPTCERSLATLERTSPERGSGRWRGRRRGRRRWRGSRRCEVAGEVDGRSMGSKVDAKERNSYLET